MAFLATKRSEFLASKFMRSSLLKFRHYSSVADFLEFPSCSLARLANHKTTNVVYGCLRSSELACEPGTRYITAKALNRNLYRSFGSNCSPLLQQSALTAREPRQREPDSALVPQSGGTATLFYKRATVDKASDNAGGWYVQLDGKTLKTPAKLPLRLPTRALALAIAAEWQYQDKDGIRSFTMPLMKLAATAIDQIPHDYDRVIEHLLKYFHTDTLCCRAPEPSLLADKQAEVWDPLLVWMEEELGARPVAFNSLLDIRQPPDVIAAAESALRQCDMWHLAAIDSLAGSAKSLTVAFAIARGRLSVKDALAVTRLEEDFQAEEWGYVEGGHDIDIADLRVRLAAPSVFLRLIKA